MLRVRGLGILVAIACVVASAAACDRLGTEPTAAELQPAVPLQSAVPADPGADRSPVASATFDADGGRLEWSGPGLQSTLVVPPGTLGRPTSFDLRLGAGDGAAHLLVRAVPVSPAAGGEESGEEAIQLLLRNPTGADQQVEVTFLPPDSGEATSIRTLLCAGDTRSLDIRRGRGRSKYSVIFF